MGGPGVGAQEKQLFIVRRWVKTFVILRGDLGTFVDQSRHHVDEGLTIECRGGRLTNDKEHGLGLVY